MPLPLPAPCPEGSADPAARLNTARAILGFSYEQTRELPGAAWQAGFRVDFEGQEGLDDGGLTKAWVAEVGFALWGDSELFDSYAAGNFFKPDEVETLSIDGVPTASVELYRWVGRFAAYALYQRCVLDCRLCPWVFRSLQRSAAPRNFFHPKSAAPDWPATPEGEDAMLADLACLDHTLASNLWRVRHEMSEEELHWLDFTYAGAELEPGGAKRQVTAETKPAYVRLACAGLLRQRSGLGLQVFAEGFFEVIPERLLEGVPEDGILRLLAGEGEVNEAQLDELERTVIPAGLVPASLRDHPRVREAAAWLFRAARAGDGDFRARLLEFWLGVSRVPLMGLGALLPRPKLQIMVQPDSRGGVRRIASWPRERLPEGHTCGNELWVALQDSYEQVAKQLQLAVQNFESGFSLR
mmetsp:Transcript_87409/g.245361  ORF Transcript_87409/g.245361 Transcript_87409/m.245361 type:complete len:412 (+) Transcript_87409:219-1454(+)